MSINDGSIYLEDELVSVINSQWSEFKRLNSDYTTDDFYDYLCRIYIYKDNRLYVCIDDYIYWVNYIDDIDEWILIYYFKKR